MKEYLSLTKPGIIMGNMLVAMSAFIFGSLGPIDWRLFLLMTGGLTLIIASGCVFNNYFDRRIDAKMERTKNRPLAAGTIPPLNALLFGFVLLLVGAALLWNTNLFALYVGLGGFAAYVLLYTPLKHVSALAMYVGAVAGATPPVVGYAAAANTLDANAAWLFAFLYVWQLPHFLAIAIFRFDEYAAAGVPMLVRSYSEKNRVRARKVFYYSLVVLLLFCGALIVQRWMR